MRYITIPEPITLKALVLGRMPNYTERQEEGQFLDFVFLVREVWTNDQKFGVNVQSLKWASSIDRKFQGLKPGDEVILDEAEWNLLKEVANNPSSAYQPRWMKSAISMIEIIDNASDKPSVKTMTDGAAAQA